MSPARPEQRKNTAKIVVSTHDGVDGFTSAYEQFAPRPRLHESAAWLRYCDRRSRGRMLYVVARDDAGVLLGVTALRRTAQESLAEANYDVSTLIRPPAVPKACFYPQLFSAVSGTHCLLRTADHLSETAARQVRAAIVGTARNLAAEDNAVLTFAYLTDARLAGELTEKLDFDEHGVVGANTVLEAEWVDFDGYVAFLPRGRRSHIRKERREYLASGLRTSVHETTRALDEQTALLEMGLARKYNAPNSVDAVLADYADLASTVDEHVLVFLAKAGDRPVGLCVCLRDGETLHIRNLGFDYPLTRGTHAYFNLMFYDPLIWGARHGIRRYCFGTGAYLGKSRRGCLLEPLYAGVRWPASLGAACAGALVGRDRDVCVDLGLNQRRGST